MKWLIFVLVVLSSISLGFSAEITGFVNDRAGILSLEEEARMTEVLQSWYDQGLVQGALVTIPSLEGRPIEDVAFELSEGVLGSEKNNGFLLLIAVEDRAYRFEVGRGLEVVLNDAKVGRYGRTLLVPSFREERYGDGVLEVLAELNKELGGRELPEVLPLNQAQSEKAHIFSVMTLVVIVLVIILLIKVFAGRFVRSDDRYFWSAVLAAEMLRGGRRGFGGFGGFGGGSFGGGGASGGW